MDGESHLLRLAGLLWLIAGLSYLSAETVAAAAFPGYSYARNYVSDLGVPYADVIDGRVLRSGLAWLMNWGGFILDGVLFAAASVIAARLAFTAKDGVNPWAAVFLVLALMHSAGTVLVGLVHSGSRELASGADHYHVLGAAMAILGGNLALLAAAPGGRHLDLPRAWRSTSTLLGLFGLGSLALLEVNRIGRTPILPDGVLERASIYPITAWEIVTGLTLLAASFRVAKVAPAGTGAT
ncbi:DUF998 domain-containing protein [Novosphingobium pentaromativorans]|uniref:DUF998 domain-containing protein n=1 Tax=Novosphingobium pentaromativorans US6-1 TaxID=1088721 RepID=G6EHD2_9SPHN|nr:DUF998 domain-containing protein [Novosphingobium pentaromativorans]AIT81910.1 hypothetical protein JI59_20270 [Novosphingobium pentaromativorans US6-1]EHJ59421.1 hypothetical protein NSU_3753 [Novosphingobium pentaromativorans US6-1]